MSDVFEVASKRLGILGVLLSGQKIILGTATTPDYVDFSLGVASVFAEGTVAPYIAAAAGTYTLWEIGVDLAGTRRP
jgi:hypothetical protein